MPVYVDYRGEHQTTIVSNRFTWRHYFVLVLLYDFYVISCSIERIFQSVSLLINIHRLCTMNTNELICCRAFSPMAFVDLSN